MTESPLLLGDLLFPLKIPNVTPEGRNSPLKSDPIFLNKKANFNCQILLPTINNKIHYGPSREDKAKKMLMIIDLDAVRIWVCCSPYDRCLLYKPSLSFRRHGVKYDETSLIIEEDHHQIAWLSRSENQQILKRAKESPKRIKPTLSDGINKIYLNWKEPKRQQLRAVTRWHHLSHAPKGGTDTSSYSWAAALMEQLPGRRLLDKTNDLFGIKPIEPPATIGDWQGIHSNPTPPLLPAAAVHCDSMP